MKDEIDLLIGRLLVGCLYMMAYSIALLSTDKNAIDEASSNLRRIYNHPETCDLLKQRIAEILEESK